MWRILRESWSSLDKYATPVALLVERSFDAMMVREKSSSAIDRESPPHWMMEKCVKSVCPIY